MEVTRKLPVELEILSKEAVNTRQEGFGLSFLDEKLRELLRFLEEIGRFFSPGPGGERWWVDRGISTTVILITAVVILLILVGLCCCCCCRGDGEKFRQCGCSADGKGGEKMRKLKMPRVFIGNDTVDYFRIRLRSKKDLLC